MIHVDRSIRPADDTSDERALWGAVAHQAFADLSSNEDGVKESAQHFWFSDDPAQAEWRRMIFEILDLEEAYVMQRIAHLKDERALAPLEPTKREKNVILDKRIVEVLTHPMTIRELAAKVNVHTFHVTTRVRIMTNKCILKMHGRGKYAPVDYVPADIDELINGT